MTLPPRLGAAGLIIASVVVALALTVVPMPDWAAGLRPQWVALVVIYWCMAAPQSLGIGMAWLAGLVLDVVSGSLFGLHGLMLATAAFLTHTAYQQVRMAPLLQQAVWVGGVLLVGQLIAYLALQLAGRTPPLSSFATVVISAFLWPWLFLILRDLRRAFSGA